jgi:hypothetical protein
MADYEPVPNGVHWANLVFSFVILVIVSVVVYYTHYIYNGTHPGAASSSLAMGASAASSKRCAL